MCHRAEGEGQGKDWSGERSHGKGRELQGAGDQSGMHSLSLLSIQGMSRNL